MGRSAGSGGNRRGHRASFGNVRRLGSGRYQARYTDPRTRQTVTAPTTFATKAPAVAGLRREAVRLESEPAGAPRVVSKPKITLSEYGTRWLAERGLRPTTRRTYGGLWKVIDADLGSRRIVDLTAPEVAEWHRGALPGRPAARANAYGLLRVILNAAVDEGLIESNPCRVRGGAASRRERQIPVVSPEQITALEDAMPARFAATVTLAAWAGLRFGEIAELRRSDLDVHAGTVSITRSATRASGGMVVGPPKTRAGVRVVSILRTFCRRSRRTSTGTSPMDRAPCCSR